MSSTIPKLISSFGFVKDCLGNVFSKEHPKKQFGLDDSLLPGFKLGDFITFRSEYSPKYGIYIINEAEVDVHSVPPEIAVIGGLRPQGAITYAYHTFLKMNADRRRFIHDHLGVIDDCTAHLVGKLTVNSTQKFWVAFVEPDVHSPHGRLRVLSPREEKNLMHMNPHDFAYRSLKKQKRAVVHKKNEEDSPMNAVEVSEYIANVPRIVVSSDLFPKRVKKATTDSTVTPTAAANDKPSCIVVEKPSADGDAPKAAEDDVDRSPTQSEKKPEPAVDEKTSEPAADEKTSEPAADEKTSEPAADEKTSEPAADEKTSEPAADEKTSEPAADEKTSEPAADEKTSEPAADEKTSEPAADEKTSEPAAIKQEVVDDEECDAKDEFVRFIATALERVQRTTPKLSRTMKDEIRKVVVEFGLKSSLNCPK